MATVDVYAVLPAIIVSSSLMRGMMVIYKRGLRRCSFNYDGQCEGLRMWDEYSHDSHALFMITRRHSNH